MEQLRRALAWRGSHEVTVDTAPHPVLQQRDAVILQITATANCRLCAGAQSQRGVGQYPLDPDRRADTICVRDPADRLTGGVERGYRMFGK